MANINLILDDIASIQEATCIAHDDVHSKINDFAEKVAVMEQCGLNVMSEDPTMQCIIENREQVIYDYQNGPMYFDESVKERWKNVGATVIGALCGDLVGSYVAKNTAASLWLAGLDTYACVIPAYIIWGVIWGSSVHIAERIRFKKRMKGIHFELTRDIEDICTELGSPFDSTKKELKALKRKFRTLRESITFALRDKEEAVSYGLKDKLRALLAVTKRAISDLDLSHKERNKNIIKKFLTAANDVIVETAGITEAESKKMQEALDKFIEEAEKNDVKQESVVNTPDDENTKEENEHAKEEE